MKKNVGSYDAAARFVLGCTILLVGRHALGWWSLLAIVPIISASTSVCLFYSALGISTTTCDETESEEEKLAHVRH